MSWLREIAREMLKDLPPGAFTDRTFGFDDIVRVVVLVEKALERNAVETADAGRLAARTAASDPLHSFTKNPVFAPMATQLWKAEATFPRVLRGALVVAIYSHTEFLLRDWCELVSKRCALPRTFANKRGRPALQAYMDFLRDEANFELGDFLTWPEWKRIDAYRRARNCLAHNGGIVQVAEDRIRIEALPQIEIDESGLNLPEPALHLLPGACEAAAEAMKEFVGRVVSVAECDPRNGLSAEIP